MFSTNKSVGKWARMRGGKSYDNLVLSSTVWSINLYIHGPSNPREMALKKILLGYMNISHKITYNINNGSYLNTLVQKLMDSESSIK